MLQLSSINPIWIRLIKIISPILMVCAIGLDLAIAYFIFQDIHLSSSYLIVAAIGSFALSAHALEGVIAAIIASRQNIHPLKYGVYTFFVGTVGLLEIYDRQKNNLPID